MTNGFAGGNGLGPVEPVGGPGGGAPVPRASFHHSRARWFWLSGLGWAPDHLSAMSRKSKPWRAGYPPADVRPRIFAVW
jgi:hypothetical protein